MGDENIKYVPEGVFLVCDKGDIPTQLICDPEPINLYSVKYADENDRKPILNIQPFGTCKVLGGPCVPPLLTWTKLKEDVRLHGFKPLLETSECICAAGGKITIFLDEYAAYLAAENNSESAFVSESISSNILGFAGLGLFAPALEMLMPGITEGVGRGIKKGAEGTWNFFTHDMWQADTWRGLGRMAVVAGVYGMNASKPAGSIQSDMMLRSLDNRFGTSFVQTRDGLATGIERGVTHAIEDVRRGNWGEVGESIGQVEYAVAEAVVGSKGAGLAVKGATAATRMAIGAERLARLAAAASRVMERLKSVSGIVRIGRRVARRTGYKGFGGDIVLDADRTTTVIGKFDDVVDGGGTREILNLPDGSFTRGGANNGGINILDIPTAEYDDLIRTYGDDLGKEMFWERYNQPFLEDSFRRGDNVRLLSNPSNPANRTGFYNRELREIEGYTDASGTRVPGLAERYGYVYDPATDSYVRRR